MMHKTHNMGSGLLVAVHRKDADKAREAIKAAGDVPYIIGAIEEGEKGVTLC